MLLGSSSYLGLLNMVDSPYLSIHQCNSVCLYFYIQQCLVLLTVFSDPTPTPWWPYWLPILFLSSVFSSSFADCFLAPYSLILSLLCSDDLDYLCDMALAYSVTFVYVPPFHSSLRSTHFQPSSGSNCTIVTQNFLSSMKLSFSQLLFFLCPELKLTVIFYGKLFSEPNTL